MSGAAGGEGMPGGRIASKKYGPHFLAHLIRRLTDTRSQPRQQFARWRLQPDQGGFQHATSQTAPTRMGSGDLPAIAGAEQYGQAIGGKNRQNLA
ncbi:hypothetical protein RF55_26013 [Lasius niger]|uniref:Uncharacterized protein n=1 Tax=Lasius niger TaxID=67767 RepID=A0A0J7JU48_LASNI|nr:hypothetical protein RF55_26013 [Lasius niger]